MNELVAISNLPLPDDCIFTIKSCLFLDKQRYEIILLKKTIVNLMHCAFSAYNFEMYGDTLPNNVYVFRWYFSHIQHHFHFCTCGNYKTIKFGTLINACKCKCLLN